MSAQWIPDRSSIWVSRSADGYYAISQGSDTGASYGAHHIPALWATPEPLGTAPSIRHAQQICDQHRAAQRAPA